MRKSLLIWLLTSALWIVLIRSRVEGRFVWQYPKLTDLVITEHYLTDLSSIGLGAHRAAADIAYVQLLQYYGNPAFAYDDSSAEPKEEPRRHHHNHHHEGHHHPVTLGTEGEGYVRLKEFGRRLLLLDPFFNRAILEVGGSLAFNLDRTGEALDYLHEAADLDPSYYRYKLYIAAVLYKSEGRDQSLINVLEKAIEHPDCPPMLENILANLLKKYGEYEKAAMVYLHMVQTVPKESDREHAKESLVKLIQNHPNLADALSPHLQ